MTWNYRIVRVDNEYGIYEVYYDDGKPVARIADPVTLLEADPGHLETVLKMVQDALTKSILDAKDIKRAA